MMLGTSTSRGTIMWLRIIIPIIICILTFNYI